ncbi:MAG: NIL domain-containing protein [Dehalococcoidia bacterium]|jgi:ABC-type methionine transport system ATPase subunit|nr:NIL domain-containing protein [Dehalococcoidia bacterium]MEE2928333.1 NIL domain-containing protein [Chloroflexota bacterium]|tara:strand:- start:729 stop:974 length:246 start_codon:yes stop_codon:yes gene_type:complete
MMGTQRVKFTFMTQLVKEPIIYQLGQNFNLVTNIRRADVREDMGWVVLELDGDDTEIQRGLDWVSAIGVRIDPVSGDVIEG